MTANVQALLPTAALVRMTAPWEFRAKMVAQLGEDNQTRWSAF